MITVSFITQDFTQHLWQFLKVSNPFFITKFIIDEVTYYDVLPGSLLAVMIVPCLAICVPITICSGLVLSKSVLFRCSSRPLKGAVVIFWHLHILVIKWTIYLQKVEAPKVTLGILFLILNEHSVQV